MTSRIRMFIYLRESGTTYALGTLPAFIILTYVRLRHTPTTSVHDMKAGTPVSGNWIQNVPRPKKTQPVEALLISLENHLRK